VKKFALIRTDRIGDLVLSLPVAEAIKDAVPGAQVSFVVSAYNAPVARACPFVDEVIEYAEKSDRLGGLVRLRRELRSRRFDVALFLRPTLRTAMAAMMAGIPVRVGTAFRFYSFLFTRRVPEHRRRAEKHEYEFNMALLASVVDLKRTDYTPRIEIDAASREFADRASAELELKGEDFAIVHPGSGGSARNFTLESYAWLADRIEEDLDVKVVFTFGPGEARLIDEIDSVRDKRSGRLGGAPHLIELAAFIEKAALFVSGSTGPMHIAAAVGTPVLSFFSPVRSTSPRRWGPLTESGRVIMPPVPECPTCIDERCEFYDCMDRVDRAAVIEAARDLLR
jgi:lipopolysaccharide heptosyltransferase II